MYYVYILANATNVAIYTGVTRDLVRRVAQHRAHADPASYTARYDITKLVYFEATPSIQSAIAREKQIKSWSRKRKNALVNRRNPGWLICTPHYRAVIASQCAHWRGNPSLSISIII